MSIHIGVRIAEKQDGSTMIIEGPPCPKKYMFFFTMWTIYMKNQLFIFNIVVHNKISSRQNIVPRLTISVMRCSCRKALV